MFTIEQMRASRRFTTDLSGDIGCPESFLDEHGDERGAQGYIYEGHGDVQAFGWIELQQDGKYNTIVGREECTDASLDVVESFLFDSWFAA